MHKALQLDEILWNIFSQCYPPNGSSRRRSDLAALARTCHTFKEPALDVLWTELGNLSPLARCLPEASHQVYPGCSWYAFTRQLVPSEWDTLRSYARRVHSIRDFTRGLNWESVRTLFNPPTPDPMFPNLRVLHWEFVKGTFPLMSHLIVPSLTSLEINFVFGDVPPLQSFPLSLGDLCPDLRKVRIRMRRAQCGSDEAVSGLVTRWSNLQVLFCPYISLDFGAFVFLSRRASLTHLSFTLSTTLMDHIASTDAVIRFPKLRDLEISSESLELTSNFIPRIQLPAIESLTAYIEDCPTEGALRVYFIGIQQGCTLHSFDSLKVIQVRSMDSFRDDDSEPFQLTVQDMLPCMAFANLRHIVINTASTVNLSDDDLVSLASAWPRLEHLVINEEWGWQTEGGVTPKGLLQLLQTLPSLHHFCLAIDTRGYTDACAAAESVLSAGFTPRIPLSVNVADSIIQPECVGALAAFFGAIMEQHVSVSSWYWSTSAMTGRRDTEILERLWEDVFMKAHESVKIQYRIA